MRQIYSTKVIKGGKTQWMTMILLAKLVFSSMASKVKPKLSIGQRLHNQHYHKQPWPTCSCRARITCKDLFSLPLTSLEKLINHFHIWREIYYHLNFWKPLLNLVLALKIHKLEQITLPFGRCHWLLRRSLDLAISL